MKLNGIIKIKGWFEVDHFRNGELIDHEVIHNTTTTAGFKEVAGLINEVKSIGFKWLALDDSSTAITSASTALPSEITTAGMPRAAATNSLVTTTNASDTAQAVHTFTATASKTVTGAGIFDTATSGGNMLAASHFASKAMVANDTLKITYKVKCS